MLRVYKGLVRLHTGNSFEDFSKKDSKLTFIDVFSEMLGTDGKPKPGIFVADKLHMNAKGYALWTKIVGPYLK